MNSPRHPTALARALASPGPQGKGPVTPQRRPLGLILLVGLAFVMLTALGYWFYQEQDRGTREKIHSNLKTVSQLKTSQILNWREERLADARMNSSGMVRTQTIQLFKTGKPALLEEVRQRLQFFQENEGYHNMILADTKGRILISLSPKNGSLEPEEDALMRRVLESGKPQFGDLYHCRSCSQLHLHVAAPVLDEGQQTLAVLFLIANPDREFFPLIESWPTVHSSAETLLVRREGDQVVFLNRLRHQTKQPLHHRVPITETRVPAVQAVLGATGIVQGRDYRGQDVLTYVNPIPDTSWFMVTKTDTQEILAESRFRATGIFLLIALATATAASLARLTHISQQKTLSEALLLAEQEGKQAREEIRATLYGINAGVIATDAQGLIRRMNPAAENLTGWQESRALNRPLAEIFQLIKEDTGERLELPLSQVLKDGAIVGVTETSLLINQEGRGRPISDSWSPLRNPQGDITGAVLVFRDQTRRRAMELARIESAKQYSNLVESVHDFIWETGADHRYSFANKRCLEMLGYLPEEFIGKRWLDLLSPEESPESIAAFKKTLTDRAPYTQLCRTFLRKDGSPVILESSATPAFDLEGRFLGYRGISRDITERKKAEEEQKHLQAQLFQAQKMDTVGRLAGGVAHDFNNMLTVICSYTEITLNELEESHHLYKRLTEVYQAALHSVELTKQLLSFARKQTITPKVLDLNQTIAGSLKMLTRLIGENIQLTWRPDPALQPVCMDPTQMGQILANLTVNARDAINGVGQLTIETANTTLEAEFCAKHIGISPGPHVLLSISDDGSGMAPETLAQIFEPFFTTKEEGRGTGLGLATVYGIIKQNGGLITASSTPGQGTTFRIYLPQALTEITGNSTTKEQAIDKGHETILLVDDEPAILGIGAYILEKLGYTVLTATSPSSALRLAEDHPGPIDLMVTDLIMPEMNGGQLAKKTLEIRPETRILFVSGYTADIIAEQCVDFNDDFLEKPFTSGRLSKKVRALLDQT